MNPLTTGQMLDQMAHLDEPALHQKMGGYGPNRKGLAVLCLVAQHAHVNLQTLDFLATSPHADVRSWVAANAKLSRTRLRRLASEHHYLIDRSLATNSSTPADVLEALVHSQDTATRLGLVRNPSTPARVIDSLSHDAEPLVSQPAQTRLTKGESAYFHRPGGKVGSP